MEEHALVIGLGNPILGDDGVGWRVADEVERRLWPRATVRVERAALGGLSLMERLVGCERAVIVDAIHTGGSAVGTVTRCRFDELANPGEGSTTSAHDMSLATALALGRTMGAAIPEAIEIVGIEVPPHFEFSEALSPAVAASVSDAATAVLEFLACGRAAAPSYQPRQEVGSHGVP